MIESEMMEWTHANQLRAFDILARTLLKFPKVMNTKPVPKAGCEKPPRKIRKGTAETTRMFIDIEGMMRQPHAPLTRYVE